jgi:hypothetical protein
MKIPNPQYLSMKYKTPQSLKGQHPNSDILIIGTGVSTQKILKYKDRLKEKFDAIIGVNFSTKDFENEMDYHVIAEKGMLKLFMNKVDEKYVYRKDLPRVFNWKIIKKYPNDMNFIKSNRNSFDGDYDIREYQHNNTEGLLIGPMTSDNLSAGTVILQSMHLACIMGAKNIYLSGADYVFSKEFDHYYKDKMYRDIKRDWQTPIITVSHNGEEYQTLRYFKESADFLNSFIVDLKKHDVGVHSFSNGLLTEANLVDIDSFMEKKNA